MWWKKKNEKVEQDKTYWKDVLKILEVIQVEQKRMEKDIDNLKFKFRNRKPLQETEEIEVKSKPKDELDHLRKIGKNINRGNIGL